MIHVVEIVQDYGYTSPTDHKMNKHFLFKELWHVFCNDEYIVPVTINFPDWMVTIKVDTFERKNKD